MYYVFLLFVVEQYYNLTLL